MSRTAIIAIAAVASAAAVAAGVAYKNNWIPHGDYESVATLESLEQAQRTKSNTTQPAARPDPVFVDVTGPSGIDYAQADPIVFISNALPEGEALIDTGGAAARDFDADGWVDLVVTRLNAPPILYHNVADARAPGGRRFVNVTPGSGLDAVPRTNGAAWGDVNNDGLPDLYLTTFSDRYYLFINQGDGYFSEQAEARGADLAAAPVTGFAHTGMSASFGDYDNDGHLDLAIGEWHAGRKATRAFRFHLLHNAGATRPGYFTDATDAAGVTTFPDPDGRTLVFTPRFADLDHDGLPDLAVTSDYDTSRTYWNNGDGTFTDGTKASGLGTDHSGMGSTFADYDRDGDLDWFVSSIFWNNNTGGDGNRLYQNRLVRPGGAAGAPRSFSDQTDLGVRNGGWGWGASFIDYDNDGWPDLVMTNGQLRDGKLTFDDPSKLWHNTGATGTIGFADVGEAAGIADRGPGKGLVVLDYDNDGAPDVFIVNNQGPPILYRNVAGAKNHWLKLQLVGTTCNRDAAGAFITVSDHRFAGKPLVWEVNDSSNFLGQSEPTAFFGLGTIADTVDRVDIAWPDGKVQTLVHVGANQFLRVTQGSTALAALPTVRPDGTAGPHEIIAEAVPGLSPDPRFAARPAATRPADVRNDRTAASTN